MSRLNAALQRAATGQAPATDAAVDDSVSVDVIVETEAYTEEGPPTDEVLLSPMVDDLPVTEEPQAEEEASGEEGKAGHSRFHVFSRSYGEKLVVSTSLPKPLREQYRRLAASMHHAQEESGLKTLMVTSAVPDEGKTLTATNVALTLSESYQRRVLLIDADLRRPSLDEVFQVPKVFGLNEALTSPTERKVSLLQVSSNLSLLTAGTPNPDPMSVLTSERMKQLLAEAAATFDWVIIDTPPVGVLTDAKLLAAMVDAALLVVRAGSTPASLIQRAVESIGRNRIVGVVLNRADPRRTPGGESYYQEYYYAPRGSQA